MPRIGVKVTRPMDVRPDPKAGSAVSAFNTVLKGTFRPSLDFWKGEVSTILFHNDERQERPAEYRVRGHGVAYMVDAAPSMFAPGYVTDEERQWTDDYEVYEPGD